MSVLEEPWIPNGQCRALIQTSYQRQGAIISGRGQRILKVPYTLFSDNNGSKLSNTCRFSKSIWASISFIDKGNNGFSTRITFLDLGSVNRELKNDFRNYIVILAKKNIKLTREIRFLDDTASWLLVVSRFPPFR